MRLGNTETDYYRLAAEATAPAGIAAEVDVEADEEAVAGVPHVVQAQRLFGDPDYLLRVVTTDLAAYQHLYDNELIALPGVQRMASTLVMKRVVHDRPLPA